MPRPQRTAARALLVNRVLQYLRALRRSVACRHRLLERKSVKL